jgi:hypothetical protein
MGQNAYILASRQRADEYQDNLVQRFYRRTCRSKSCDGNEPEPQRCQAYYYSCRCQQYFAVFRADLVHGDKAVCEANGQILTRGIVENTQYDIISSATFVLKLVRVERVWKLVSLGVVYDKDNLVPVVNPPAKKLVIDYPRESYKCLAYILAQSRYMVDSNLPGWDRREQALQHLQSARDWIHT